MDSILKSPRLYIDAAMAEGIDVDVGESATHYLKNVMRMPEGAALRVFNGQDGEYTARIADYSKRAAKLVLERQLRTQPSFTRRVHLYAAPLKKERMDFLVEKAVELGVTDIHSVLTDHADVRKINEERVRTQIIEASEQCERLDIPTLHTLADMKRSVLTANYPVYAAIERDEALRLLKNFASEKDCGLLIGPAGGFSEDEIAWLKNIETIQTVSLGRNVLRAETAVLAGLALINLT